MRRKFKYIVLDDVEQIVVIVEDGSIATAHNNEEFIVVNSYSLGVPSNFNDDNMEEAFWQYLDTGWRSWKFLVNKQKVDEEVITTMLHSVYGEYEYEKVELYDCCCEWDIKKFLNIK